MKAQHLCSEGLLAHAICAYAALVVSCISASASASWYGEGYSLHLPFAATSALPPYSPAASTAFDRAALIFLSPRARAKAISRFLSARAFGPPHGDVRRYTSYASRARCALRHAATPTL